MIWIITTQNMKKDNLKYVSSHIKINKRHQNQFCFLVQTMLCCDFFQLCLHDPVYTSSLQTYVMSELEKCQTLYGVETFNTLLTTIDPDVHIQLKHYLK